MQNITTVFFDLDDTLYNSENGLWEAIRKRMGKYMENLLDLPPEEVDSLRRHYYLTYGTTLRGLQMHHDIDSIEYLTYVHDLPLEEFLQPDISLRELLNSLPLRKFIFTNADLYHAQRVLDVLGVNGCFDGIVDVLALEYLCKPQPEAYLKALELAGIDNPQECLYLDDSTRNLSTARDMGIITVLVGDSKEDPSACYSIANVKDLPLILPEIWDQRGR